MIVCSDCGSEFEKPEIYREAHSLSAPPFEERRCCPFCKCEKIHEKCLTHFRCCGARVLNGDEY